MTSEHFAGDRTAAIQTHDPLLVQLDPLYVYFGEDREAGNVFSTGPALVRLRELTTGRALEVAHHFTKASADRLTLASLTQAGMREAVDHWLLLSVKEFDLEEQRFTIDMDRGARRGLAWSKKATVVLGPFDHDTLKHTGEPSVELTSRAKAASSDKVRACARAATRAVERAHTEHGEKFKGVSQRWIQGQINVDAATDKKRAGIEEAVRVGALRTEPGPNRSILHFWVKEYPGDDDE